MRELSLFTGAGGGLLGTHLLGWKPVGYVEWDSYCQRVLAARIRDGYLPNAPIYGDIRAFNRDGYAAAYQGMVDVVTGGFPCQPFSVAGKQLGADDPRNMWPATIECIRLVRPRYCLLENVPGLIAAGYLLRILGDLAEAGYDARWGIVSAESQGAPHRRERLWIVADSGRGGEREIQHELESGSDKAAHSCISSEAVADSGHAGVCERGCGSSSWWSTEPGMGRVVDGVANRVGRLRAIGNGQVPAVVRAAWEMLSHE